MEASGKPAPCGKHIVLWSVAVPSKHLLSSNGEKQVVLSLDLDKQTICISAFPDVRQSVEDGVSNAAAKFVSDSAAVEATSARQRATSRTVDSSGLGTARSSISQADWNIVFGQPPREKKSKRSRWPWTIAFSEVRTFVRGFDCRSLTFSLQYDKTVSVTFLTPEEREVFCNLLFLSNKNVLMSDEGEVWTEKPALSVSYPVQSITYLGSSEKIFLKITFDDERMHVIWLRKRNTHLHSGRPLAIKASWKFERDRSNKQKLTIKIPSLESPLVVKFPSVSLRERFCGHLRTIMSKLDLLRIEQGGWKASNLKDEELSVWACTFNAADTISQGSRTVANLLGQGHFDIVSVVLEECKNKEQWVADMQTAFRTEGGLRGNNYQLVGTMTLWAIHIMVYAKESVYEHISNVRIAEQATGMGGIMGNKGGVAVGFTFKDSTRFCFVGSHLAARCKRLKERRQNYMDICAKMKPLLFDEGCEFLHQYDFVFWGGDLNYRINILDGPGYDTEEEFKAVNKMIREGDYKTLQSHDQLLREINANRVFQGFQEGPINFAPTYRMVRGRHDYSNKRFQAPSYTDRIVWKTLPGLEDHVKCEKYGGLFNMMQSDHRAVYGVYKVKLKVPFYNVVRKGNFYGSENCDINFRSMSISLTTEEQLKKSESSKLTRSAVGEEEDSEDDMPADLPSNSSILPRKRVLKKGYSSFQSVSEIKAPVKQKKKESKFKRVAKFLVRSMKSDKTGYANTSEQTGGKGETTGSLENTGGKKKGRRKSLLETAIEKVTNAGMDTGSPKELFFTINAEFLESPLTSHIITATFDPDRGVYEAEWDEDMIPTLFPIVGDASFVRKQCVSLVLRMRDEFTNNSWKVIGHGDLSLSHESIPVLTAQERRQLSEGVSQRRKFSDSMERVIIPLVLHGVSLGEISIRIQIRRMIALEGDLSKQNLMYHAERGAKLSFRSMRMSNIHSADELMHVKSLDGLLSENEEIVEDFVAYEEILRVDPEAEIREREEQVRRKFSGIPFSDETAPPPPSFTLKEHRMSASLFHLDLPPPPPPDGSTVAALPPPPAFDASRLLAPAPPISKTPTSKDGENVVVLSSKGAIPDDLVPFRYTDAPPPPHVTVGGFPEAPPLPPLEVMPESPGTMNKGQETLHTRGKQVKTKWPPPPEAPPLPPLEVMPESPGTMNKGQETLHTRGKQVKTKWPPPPPPEAAKKSNVPSAL